MTRRIAEPLRLGEDHGFLGFSFAHGEKYSRVKGGTLLVVSFFAEDLTGARSAPCQAGVSPVTVGSTPAFARSRSSVVNLRLPLLLSQSNN